MQQINIWQEGHNISGTRENASRVGSIEVSSLTTFREACKLYHVDHPDESYDPRENAICYCKLFDNEDQTRLKFG